MRISVFGLGYVGSVSAACLAERGHEVIGVDVNPEKVAQIAGGRSPIVEPGLAEILARSAASGALDATTDCRHAIASSEISLICVGTPSDEVGRPDLGYVRRIAAEIGDALRAKGPSRHVIVLRSTVPPGTTEDLLVPQLAEHSGLRAGTDFRVAYNPEFLREGSAVADFLNPSKTVVGADPDVAALVDTGLYGGLPGPHIVTGIRVAEAVKYVANAFHALKVAFANEIGQLCRAEGVEASDVMEIFVQDTKLNISPAYLRPGFAFGGACLPKDLRAIMARARAHSLELPVLGSVLRSNGRLIEEAVALVRRLDRRRVAILGLSFKHGTDDLRESPMVELVERLLGKGFDLSIHDRSVNLSRLLGANKAYIEAHLPHIAQLIHEDLDHVVSRGEVVVIGSRDPSYKRLESLVSREQHVVDLVRLFERAPSAIANYSSIV